MDKQEKYPFVGDAVYRRSCCFIYRQRLNNILGSDAGRFVWDAMSKDFHQVTRGWRQFNALDSALNLVEPA